MKKILYVIIVVSCFLALLSFLDGLYVRDAAMAMREARDAEIAPEAASVGQGNDASDAVGQESDAPRDERRHEAMSEGL